MRVCSTDLRRCAEQSVEKESFWEGEACRARVNALSAVTNEPWGGRMNHCGPGRILQWLGMTLVDPSPVLLERHALLAHPAGPIVLHATGEHAWQWDVIDGRTTAPQEGCAFWMVTFSGNLFAWDTPGFGRHPTGTLRQLAQVILAQAIAPDDHVRLCREAAQRFRNRAAALPDGNPQRAELLSLADQVKVHPHEVGFHICGVVYSDPAYQGTMTTQVRLNGDDLEELRAFLRQG